MSIAAGFAVVGFAMLLIARISEGGGLGRNSAVGLRTSATLASESAWRRGHEVIRPYARRGGIIALSAAAASLVLALSGGDPVWLLLCWIPVLGVLLLGAVRGHRAAREIGEG